MPEQECRGTLGFLKVSLSHYYFLRQGGSLARQSRSLWSHILWDTTHLSKLQRKHSLSSSQSEAFQTEMRTEFIDVFISHKTKFTKCFTVAPKHKIFTVILVPNHDKVNSGQWTCRAGVKPSVATKSKHCDDGSKENIQTNASKSLKVHILHATILTSFQK